jgi:hypothetical protein
MARSLQVHPRAGLVLLSNSAPKNLMRDKAWKNSQNSTSKVLQTQIVAHDQMVA